MVFPNRVKIVYIFTQSYFWDNCCAIAVIVAKSDKEAKEAWETNYFQNLPLGDKMRDSLSDAVLAFSNEEEDELMNQETPKKILTLRKRYETVTEDDGVIIRDFNFG